MLTRHHEVVDGLVHEFPEYKDQIHTLKMNDDSFKELFDVYHHLTRSVKNMNNEVLTVSSSVEEKAKMRRVDLKAQLYALLLNA